MDEGHQKYRTELPKPVRSQLDMQDQYDLKQLRQALRGERALPPQKAPAAKPVVPRNGPQDLVSSLASRLTKVEAENQQLKTMLKRANDENTSLRQKIELCRLAAAGEQANVEEIIALRTYVNTLQQQIYDIEMFLDEQGLIYVECDRDDSRTSRAPRGAAQAVPDLGDPYLPPTAAWTAPERHILENNIRKLNQLVSKDRVVVEDGSKQACYNDKPSVPVRFYPDGIFIKRGPFRSFEQDKTAREFVEDIAAGFLPSEFRTSNPDGISIEASFESEPFKRANIELFRGQARVMKDEAEAPPPPKPAQGTVEAAMEEAMKRDYLTVSEYGVKNNRAFDELHDQRANLEKPMSLQHFLSRVQGNCVSNGQVISIKKALGSIIKGDAGNGPADKNSSELSSTIIISESAGATGPEDSDKIATLRVRVVCPDASLNDRHILLKLPFHTTIQSTIAKIGDSLQVDSGRIRLHRPFGRDIMEDLNATLEEMECTPNARLFVKIGV